MAKLRILLADDHTLFRHGLRKILEERADWEVVAEAGDGREAMQKTLALKPDVVLLDVSMPSLNGIEATRQILRRMPDTRVLILSMHSDEAYVLQALQAGARGYLLKDSAAQDLIAGVSALMAGRSFFSPTVAQLMLEDYVRRLTELGTSDRYAGLSEREREILQLVAEGRSSKEIADVLSIAPSTVETHRAHILQKLDIHSTAELVLYAVRRGIVS